MKYIAPLTVDMAEVQRSERRAIQPLGIKVDWNCFSRDEIAFCRMSSAARAASLGITQHDVMATAAADSDWGETDSLANVPRRKMPGWVAAVAMRDNGGDE